VVAAGEAEANKGIRRFDRAKYEDLVWRLIFDMLLDNFTGSIIDNIEVGSADG
jgi:hypothetical protein